MSIEIWHENGGGLLEAGWWAADDEHRVGPYLTRNDALFALKVERNNCLNCRETHTKDADCAVDERTGCCTICGVSHTGDPCEACGGRGYHQDGCSEVDADEPTMLDAIQQITSPGGDA